MTPLAELKPKKKINLIELVMKAGHDVLPWHQTKGHPASNPNFCYEWCFQDPKAGFIFNLWHEEMVEDEYGITVSGNKRDMLAKARSPDLNLKSKRAASSRIKRARLFDDYLREILNTPQTFNVIIQSGSLQSIDTYESAKAEKRMLDNSVWRLQSYNLENGDYVLARGAVSFVDQFSNEADIGNVNPKKAERTSKVYHRDPKVRNAVLLRSEGYCEHCAERGFQTPHGLYLETHHIIPLSEGGPDTIDNVIALCPNDHRKAHFGVQKDEMRAQLFESIFSKT